VARTSGIPHHPRDPLISDLETIKADRPYQQQDDKPSSRVSLVRRIDWLAINIFFSIASHRSVPFLAKLID
jgi:hypothetical protein